MRLVTYVQGFEKRAGLIIKDVVIDLERASRDEQFRVQGMRPLPATVKGILEQGEVALAVCSRVGSLFLELVEEGFETDFCFLLHETDLDPPVPDPQKIICIGQNYRDHCEEQGKPLPESPVVFAKFPTALIGQFHAILKPPLTEKMDYEAELGVVIGREAKNVSEQDALSYVAGYTIINDVSARDIQFADGQWVRGKSFDTFCPAGPYLVTKDEVGDPQNLTIRLTVNGEERQRSNTSNMVFSVAYLVSYLSQVCTLLPGDMISTGTPGGVGVFRDPPVFLKKEDVISVEIEKLGTLTNAVIELRG